MPQQACASMPIDIITMDVTHQLPYGLRRQQIGQVINSLPVKLTWFHVTPQAVERGVVFEICYTPTLLGNCYHGD